MALSPIDYTPGQDNMQEVFDKINAIVTAVNSLQGGSATQIPIKQSGTDFDFALGSIETLFASKTGKAKYIYRVNAGETAAEYVQFADSGYQEINSARTEVSGTPFIDAEATIFTITTPNDGVTRDYHIILTSVIDANTGSQFGYNSYFKIGSTYHSSNLAQIPSGDAISYTHNAVLSAVPPNTAILIRDKREGGTTGRVNLSKLTYLGVAN